MLSLPFQASPAQPGEVNAPLWLKTPNPPGREPFRHILLGSPASIRQTIHTLHVLQYAEQSTWSRLVNVPANGIVIMPEHGAMMSLLVKFGDRL
ncbi:MAG TPA: hypothetical protein V6C65_34665 [Allocoleopsis sp.]